MKSALVYTTGNSGETFKMDCVEREGKTWLVPTWIESLDGRYKVPARLILLDNLPHEVTPGAPFGDFLLNIALPIELLNRASSVPSKEPFVVIDLPDGSPEPPSSTHH